MDVLFVMLRLCACIAYQVTILITLTLVLLAPVLWKDALSVTTPLLAWNATTTSISTLATTYVSHVLTSPTVSSVPVTPYVFNAKSASMSIIPMPVQSALAIV